MLRRLLILSVGIVMLGPALPLGPQPWPPLRPRPPQRAGRCTRTATTAGSTTRRTSLCAWSGSTGLGPKMAVGPTIRRSPTSAATRGATPADGLGDLPFDYDNSYQVIKDLGYNVLRLPISWHNLEPVAPVWDAGTGAYVHTWNQAYLNDLKSMVTKAHAVGLMVILDMHQDYWSPALAQHHQLGRRAGLLRRASGCPGGCTRPPTARPPQPRTPTSTTR